MVQPGRVARTLLRWLMREARIAVVRPLSPHFRLIDLEGEALRGLEWSAGQKIQIAMGRGLTARTYTPICWDAERGTARLLAYIHGNGPGSHWAERLREGDLCQFLGPRRSLDFSSIGKSVRLFGDETSIAIAIALRERFGNSLTCILEVSDVAQSRTVLNLFGLENTTLIPRSAGDAHLAELTAAVAYPTDGATRFVLTGKASSIQHLSRALKAGGITSSQMLAKAYWASGKAGLD